MKCNLFTFAKCRHKRYWYITGTNCEKNIFHPLMTFYSSSKLNFY